MRKANRKRKVEQMPPELATEGSTMISIEKILSKEEEIKELIEREDIEAQRLIEEAKSAQVALRLTVLEVNPARRFYERHGFVLTHTISPRHHMEWRGR